MNPDDLNKATPPAPVFAATGVATLHNPVKAALRRQCDEQR